jgi:hypothetical protein
MKFMSQETLIENSYRIFSYKILESAIYNIVAHISYSPRHNCNFST